MPHPVLAIILSLSGFTVPALAQELPARALVHGEHQGGGVVYRYQVRNDGTGEIRRFYIGCDCRSPDATGIPELQVLPVGARPVRTDDFGTWYEASADATGQPPGWRVRILRPRHASGHWIEWSMASAQAGAGIGPGTSLGFSVALPQADTTHLSARFSVHWQGGKTATASAPLALADTTPPTLSLTAQATSTEAGATATVHIVPAARDDHDPEPRVVVESVERAESGTGGPVYTVLYSATDASGNRATATARVPVPTERSKPPVPGAGLPSRASLP